MHVSSTGFPQRRRLHRAADLPTFRAALADLAISGTPLDARRRAVILPTRAAASVFRETIERHALADRRAIVLPDLLTRDEWIARLLDALPERPALLSRTEREVLFRRAAERAAGRARMAGAPFELRPGLVAEMLNLYDELGRRQRTVEIGRAHV